MDLNLLTLNKQLGRHSEELKKKGADIIILLSHLDENEEINLINNVKGIDILITGHSRTHKEPMTKMVLL